MLRRLRAPATAVAALAVLFALATGSTTGEPATAPAVVAAKPAVRHTATATQPAISFTQPVAADPAGLERFYGQRVAWGRCARGWGDCASVWVPLDYDDPEGATVPISLYRLPAGLPAKRKGTLFINPGGPGGSGTDFAREAHRYLGEDVRAVWDVVGFDPRGIGESAGFDCLTDRDLDELYAADPTPETTAERRALDRADRARLQGCLARGGPLALHMGTESVARDLDILRAAVGDERLNYLGVSYGTMIGAMYADFFTSRVGYVVLDSGVVSDGFDTPDVTQAEYDADARAQARELEAAVADFAEACGGGCSLGGDGAAVSDTIVRVLDGLERRPLPTKFETLPRLTEGWAAAAVRAGLEDEGVWPYLVEALERAQQGDGSDLAWLAMADTGREEDGTYPGASFGKNHLPVTCADWPPTRWDTMTPSPQVVREFPLLARLSPRSGDPCAGWPGPRRQNLLVGAEPATPIVVIGNEHDPVTSIGGTEYLASVLVRSRLVRVDAYGHGAYGSGNACADRAVGAYLASGIAPPDDTRCPAE